MTEGEGRGGDRRQRSCLVFEKKQRAIVFLNSNLKIADEITCSEQNSSVALWMLKESKKDNCTYRFAMSGGP